MVSYKALNTNNKKNILCAKKRHAGYSFFYLIYVPDVLDEQVSYLEDQG